MNKYRDSPKWARLPSAGRTWGSPLSVLGVLVLAAQLCSLSCGAEHQQQGAEIATHMQAIESEGGLGEAMLYTSAQSLPRRLASSDIGRQQTKEAASTPAGGAAGAGGGAEPPSTTERGGQADKESQKEAKAAEEPPKILLPKASELYESIKLNRYYGDRLKPNMSAIEEKWRDVQYWQKWEKYDLSSFWAYYSLDVASALGDDFKITDKAHVLNQLDSDIKYLEVSQYKDLVIETLKIDENDVFSDPDIYISLGDTAPTLWKHDVQCDFWGEDICLVSGKDIQERNVTKITIGIFCLKECKFRVQAELDPELIFTPGRMHKFYFKENQQRILKFQIPESNETSQVEIKGVNENKFAKWEMMILQGNNVPNTGDALLLYPAWENGYIGHFIKHCYCFCTGCNYTVLVSAKSSGYISLGAKTSNNQVDLRTFPGGETYDTVYDWGAQCYKYQVTDPDKDFRVRLESYSGNPDAYVNPLAPITLHNYTRAQFNSKDWFWNEELVLEPSTRAKHGALTGMYYICVFGSTGSAYKIGAKNADHSIMLKPGLSESGYIDHHEIKQYYFYDNLLLDPEARVKFSGHLMSGAVKLMTKLCPKPANMKDLQSTCFLTKQEMLAFHKDERLVDRAVGSQEEKPDPNICSGSQQLDVLQKLNSATEAHCIYAVGVIGIANQTSHFSLMVELKDPAGRNHPILLSEGVPQLASVRQAEPKFFMITIDDPNIIKLKIQLTTIHGNPDIFVSTRAKEPSWTSYEKQSRFNGFYPDIIEFRRTPTYNLTKNFYIGVYGAQQSSFSLNYFTEDAQGEIGFQKLLVGKKQKGIIHVNWDKIKHPDTPVLDQPSLVYHFQVSSSLLKDGTEVQVRLNAEHGTFIFVVQELLIPQSVADETESDLNPARFIGSESQHVEIKADQLVSLKQKDKESHSRLGQKASSEELIDFYVRVYPYILAQDLYDRDIVLTEPYVFNIAFYDEVKQQQLMDGLPQRGVVRNQTFDYYSFEIDDESKSYEISLQPISGGNPDLVFSLDPENEFPDKDEHTYISKNEFTTDSIVVMNTTLATFTEKWAKAKKKPLKMYIGVYTSSPLAIYSLVVTKMIEFAPIKLQFSQIQAGSVVGDNKKYFSIKTTSQQGMPLQFDVMPRNGDLEMELTILKDSTISPSQMLEASKSPDKVKQVRGQYGSLLVDPDKDRWFKEKCDPSCLIIIAVKQYNFLKSNDKRVYFKIQVSQEFQELIEGMQVDGMISSLTGTKYNERQIDRSRYKFFKFYKACGQECDLKIDVFPHGLRNRVLSVLVNYYDPRNKAGIATKLPTWSTDPTWQVSIKYGSQITIEGTEPYFTRAKNREYQKNGAVGKLETSAGLYLIALHSFEDCTFSIKANVVKRISTGPSLKKPLKIEQIYQGRQDNPVYIMAGQTKYFYFKNWRNDDLKFKMEYLTRNIKMNEYIEVRVGRLLDAKDAPELEGADRIVPVHSQRDLDERWKPNRNSTPAEYRVGDIDFCLFCTYVIEVKNTFASIDDQFVSNPNRKGSSRRGDVRFRLIVEQTDSETAGDNEYLFKGELRLAEPRPIELDKDQTIFLVLKDDKPFAVVVEVEMLLGEAEMTLYRYTDNKVFFQYPCPKNASHHIQENIVKFNLSLELPNTTLFDDEPELFPYALKITAKTKIFQANAYLRKAGSLDIISDGRSKHLSFVYQGGDGIVGSTRKQTKASYFLFLPTSHNLELQLNTQLTKYSSDQGTIHFKDDHSTLQVRNGLGQMWNGLDQKFFTFKVGLKRIQLANDLIGKDVSWTDEFVNDKQFDYVIQSTDKSDDDKVFRMVEFEVDPQNDVILVRAEGIFDPSYAHSVQSSEVEYQLKISSSEVNYLAPGETTRAIVSDSADRFKIFEFFVNRRQFPHPQGQKKQPRGRSEEMDLFIQMTPCTGLLELYISDDYQNLFSKGSELQSYSAGSTTALHLQDMPKNVGSIEVEHKRSEVRKFKKNQVKNLELDMYQDDFGTQGKRIKNVQHLNHRKIYIGIKTLDEEEMDEILYKREQKEIQMRVASEEAKKRREVRRRQFSPLRGKFSHSHGMISTFEIKAEYVPRHEPDELDMYRVHDFNYGIQFAVEGRKPHLQETFTWSPIEKLNVEAFHRNQTAKVYNKQQQGVVYKLYLGYEEETIDMFSSLCQMEAQNDAVPIESNRLRRLLEDKEQSFLDEERKDGDRRFGNYRVITVKDSNQVTLKGKDYTTRLANAVVIAYIYDLEDEENEGKPHIFAYAPVSFDQVFLNDFVHHKNFKIILIITLLSIVVLAFVLLIFIAFYCVKLRAKREFIAEMKGPGLQMRNMPYDVCTYDRNEIASTQGSMEAESGRVGQVQVSELSQRTNTIENTSVASSGGASDIQKTEKVDSSSDEDEK